MLLPAGALFIELGKIAAREEAKGIPSRSTSHELPTILRPTTFEYAIHSHEAIRRGHHFDLRLGDPATGHAHSWALPPQLPEPGKTAWAIHQPTHTVRYMDFEGEIPGGYGAGKVTLRERGKAEILRSLPGHISFNVYDSKGAREFVLHCINGKKWKLFNRTPTREGLKVPSGKPDYKQISPEKMRFDNDHQVMSAKIDDAHNLFVLPEAGRPVRVVSHRAPKRVAHTNLIEHSHKLESLQGVRTPVGLGDTILRGGIYAINPKTGKATEAHILGGLLNTNVWKSREKQKKEGELRAVLYDVERYRGKDVSKAPYAQKLDVLREVVKKIPAFELPPMAFDEKSKRKLFEDIAKHRLPHTKEGVVLWNLEKGESPTKVKLSDEHDVYVRKIFPGEGKYLGRAAGGFEYSHSPEGPIVGKVGTGLSDALRNDLHLHPGRYLGAVATLKAQQKFSSGALRAPRFSCWHLDKTDQFQLDKMVSK